MKRIEVNLFKITHFGPDNQKSARKIKGLDNHPEEKKAKQGQCPPGSALTCDNNNTLYSFTYIFYFIKDSNGLLNIHFFYNKLVCNYT